MGIQVRLPSDMLYRHPFPRPGLGAQIMGEVRKPYADLLRRAAAVLIEEPVGNGFVERVSQALAVLLPVKSVGVVADSRAEEHFMALRAVETVDSNGPIYAPILEFPRPCLAAMINEVGAI